ncbi:phage portal protein [soil metagenome]
MSAVPARLEPRLLMAVPLGVSVPDQMPRAQPYGQMVEITSSAQLEEYLKTGGLTASGATVNPDSAMRVAAVYASVRLITGGVKNLPLEPKRRIDDRTRTDAVDHPLWTILKRKPNRWQTPSEFKQMLQAHVCLRGNGYALKVKLAGKLLELVPLNAATMEVKQLDNLELAYSYTRKNGSKIVFPQEDIFHLRGMTLDGITGVSPITYAREAIGLAMSTEKHGATLFKNGTQLGLVLEHPNKLGKEGLEFLKESLENYRGSENSGKSFVAEEGMKVKTDIGMTSEDAQYLDTRKFQRSDIFMFYGIPPFMAGDTEKSTSWGTGLEQQKDAFTTFTLEDHLTMWEEACVRDLVGDDETDIYIRFNRAALLKGDSKTRWATHVSAMQWGVHSPNDVRALEDENPRGGGDVYYPPPNTAGDPAKDDTSEEKPDDDQKSA